MTRFQIPTIFVILGATGDLMAKKIIPSLFHLYEKQKLPDKTQIIGYSRRAISDAQFRDHVRSALAEHRHIELDTLSEDFLQAFLDLFSYHQGTFDKQENYKTLADRLGKKDDAWQTCANKLFYLAVPPKYYETIFHNLAESGLTIACGEDGGWTRVLVEKPFGKDCDTAQQLDTLMGSLFKEEQIYRIDHYLAKEMLQNIITFRFSNNLLEASWNNKCIEKIEIRLFEQLGVEERGAFYDGVGALRDVGQNHLLQMLALATMDDITSFDASKVRSKRAEILKHLPEMTPEEVTSNTYRGQYEGYTNIEGVPPHSQTETYFHINTTLTHPRWEGVPISIEGGKRIKENRKEVRVTFKQTTPCLCFPETAHFRNEVIFSLEPKEGIQINFLAKKPGLDMELTQQQFDFTHRATGEQSQYVEEYEKLLLDCIEGNQLLFVSTEEVEAMWRFIDPIIHTWDSKNHPLHTYKPVTDDASKQAETYLRKQNKNHQLKKEIGVVGLGKMGGNIACQLVEKGWQTYGYNRTDAVTKKLSTDGIKPTHTIKELVHNLTPPRIVWIMVPAGKPVEETLFGKNGMLQYLEKGDIIIEAGNSYYKDDQARAQRCADQGVHFVDAGVSGGPSGARYGACIMVGGKRQMYDYLHPLFVDITVPQGTAFFEGVGAGHFVKMIHNGIEYGMMQAIAEGFAVMKKSDFKLDLTKIASVYNNGSVIESRLIEWLHEGLKLFGEDLHDISGAVHHSGEGQWTVETAKEMKIKTKIIEESLNFRIQSEHNPSYTGQIVNTLRTMFGGHPVKKTTQYQFQRNI
jgi:glucose-6-phosphate 1-dehydrogenase